MSLISADLPPSCSPVFTLTSLFLRYLGSWLRARHELGLENLALRHQLAILRRQVPKPTLHGSDRWLWVTLKRRWPHWRRALLICQPETVIGWQRVGLMNVLALEVSRSSWAAGERTGVGWVDSSDVGGQPDMGQPAHPR